jgi:aminoglycoside phosphotransferase (APT) family kinase protein
VPAFTIAQQIDFWRSFGARFSADVVPPAALAWLDEASRTVEALPLGLVHWDFHHENMLIDQDEQAWVIDWTQFQATDIRFDLAWTLVVLASERDEGMAQAVRAGYYAQRGWDAAAVEAEMNFFEAAACAKRLISVLISLSAGADAVGMRPGAEAIMSSRLSRIALVYKRWLALTNVTLPSVETLLVGHL